MAHEWTCIQTHTCILYTVHHAARRSGCRGSNILTSLQLPPRWLFSSLTVSHYRTVGKGWGSEETEAGPALSPAALPSPTRQSWAPQQSVLTGPGIGWYVCRRTPCRVHVRRYSHNRRVYRCTGVMHRHIATEYAYRRGMSVRSFVARTDRNTTRTLIPAAPLSAGSGPNPGRTKVRWRERAFTQLGGAPRGLS